MFQNSPANLEILKLDNVESYFSSIFPEPEAKPLTSSEWNSAYSQGRPFMPLPAAAGQYFQFSFILLTSNLLCLIRLSS